MEFDQKIEEKRAAGVWVEAVKVPFKENFKEGGALVQAGGDQRFTDRVTLAQVDPEPAGILLMTGDVDPVSTLMMMLGQEGLSGLKTNLLFFFDSSCKRHVTVSRETIATAVASPWGAFTRLKPVYLLSFDGVCSSLMTQRALFNC